MSEMTTPYPLPPTPTPTPKPVGSRRGDVDTHRGCTACEGGHVGTELCHCGLGAESLVLGILPGAGSFPAPWSNPALVFPADGQHSQKGDRSPGWDVVFPMTASEKEPWRTDELLKKKKGG